jgi:hypothetical protein
MSSKGLSDAQSHGLGEDETEFFAGRPAHDATIGHDLCISLCSDRRVRRLLRRVEP